MVILLTEIRHRQEQGYGLALTGKVPSINFARGFILLVPIVHLEEIGLNNSSFVGKEELWILNQGQGGDFREDSHG